MTFMSHRLASAALAVVASVSPLPDVSAVRLRGTSAKRDELVREDEEGARTAAEDEKNWEEPETKALGLKNGGVCTAVDEAEVSTTGAAERCCRHKEAPLRSGPFTYQGADVAHLGKEERKQAQFEDNVNFFFESQTPHTIARILENDELLCRGADKELIEKKVAGVTRESGVRWERNGRVIEVGDDYGRVGALRAGDYVKEINRGDDDDSTCGFELLWQVDDKKSVETVRKDQWNRLPVGWFEKLQVSSQGGNLVVGVSSSDTSLGNVRRGDTLLAYGETEDGWIQAGSAEFSVAAAASAAMWRFDKATRELEAGKRYTFIISRVHNDAKSRYGMHSNTPQGAWHTHRGWKQGLEGVVKQYFPKDRVAEVIELLKRKLEKSNMAPRFGEKKKKQYWRMRKLEDDYGITLKPTVQEENEHQKHVETEESKKQGFDPQPRGRCQVCDRPVWNTQSRTKELRAGVKPQDKKVKNVKAGQVKLQQKGSEWIVRRSDVAEIYNGEAIVRIVLEGARSKLSCADWNLCMSSDSRNTVEGSETYEFTIKGDGSLNKAADFVYWHGIGGDSVDCYGWHQRRLGAVRLNKQLTRDLEMGRTVDRRPNKVSTGQLKSIAGTNQPAPQGQDDSVRGREIPVRARGCVDATCISAKKADTQRLENKALGAKKRGVCMKCGLNVFNDQPRTKELKEGVAEKLGKNGLLMNAPDEINYWHGAEKEEGSCYHKYKAEGQARLASSSEANSSSTTAVDEVEIDAAKKNEQVESEKRKKKEDAEEKARKKAEADAAAAATAAQQASVSAKSAATSASIAVSGADAAIATAIKEAAAEKARKEAEDKARRAAEDKARRAAEDKARRAAEEKARRGAEEKARKVAEEKARKEAIAAARRNEDAESKKKARKEAEEKARKAAEEKALGRRRNALRAEEKARKAAGEKEKEAQTKKAPAARNPLPLSDSDSSSSSESDFSDVFTSDFLSDDLFTGDTDAMIPSDY